VNRTTHRHRSHNDPRGPGPVGRGLLAMLAACLVALVLGATPTFAAETEAEEPGPKIGVVKFFGGNGTEGGKFEYGIQGIAINQSGAGGVSPGDVYATDLGNHRVQEFTASGEFVRAFGLDVGGAGVDVCTVAASCQAGTVSEAAGSLFAPESVAIDQATGAVYVTGERAGTGQHSNFRIDAFSATGQFEGAFGWNVKASGGAEELQFCTTESGCKAGSEGFGAGQFSVGEGNDHLAVSPLNGHLIVGDVGNRRIDEFAPVFEGGKVTGASFVRGYGWGVLDGAKEFQVCTTVCHETPLLRPYYEGDASELGRFDRAEPRDVAVDQNGRVYASNEFNEGHEVGEPSGTIKRIETFSAAGAPEGTFVEGERFYAISANASNGNVLAMGGSNLSVYGPSGEQLATYLKGVSNRAFLSGVAQNENSEEIYLTVFDPEYGVIVLGEPVPPSASIEPVSTFTGTTATFEGQVNPEGLFTKYHFEYSADGVHWTALPTGELPADSEEHAVSAEVSGLEAHTAYRVRLVAEKFYGSGSAEAETSFETGSAPPISSALGARDITDTAAQLTATINPENEATSYRFECVTEAQFEASEYAEAREVPSGGATLEAGGEALEVSQPLTGLSPSSAYRCRLEAGNGAGEAAPLETGFATYAAQPLGPPDQRAYEQATPVNKNGGDAEGAQRDLRVAPDGSASTYFINGGGSAEEGGGQHFPIYTAMRGASSWSGRGFLPNSTYGSLASVVGWSESLRRDYVLAWHSGEAATLYEQDLESGAMSEIVGGLTSLGESVEFAAESRDGTRVLFESPEALNPEGKKGASNLYLWDRATRTLSLVDLLPNGARVTGGAFAGSYEWAFGNPESGGGGGGYFTQQLHALSEDGSTAFFTSNNVNQLYARSGLGGPSPTTVQVSASQKTNGAGKGGSDPRGPKKAAFMQATPDGRYVFFTSQEQLTNDATTGSEDQGNDLYRYDTQTGELIDIAPDSTDANGAEVQATLGASADGSYVYFAANGVLAEGASAGNCVSSAVPPGWGFSGACSIYVWHEGSIGFVAPTGGGQAPGESSNWNPTSHGGGRVVQMRTGQVSAEGILLFASNLSPTSYDGEGKQELYRYAPGAGLDCVSCNPTGAPPRGGATVSSISEPLTPTAPSVAWPRNLSADGKRVFFESEDQLVASDLNHAQDVYEWEAKGTGSCHSEAQDGGCLFLISTGESPDPSYFAGASESGDDAFFYTRQRLVRQDEDRLVDVYDARVGGGLASQNEEPRARCEGEACRGPASAAPESQSAASASFAGPGNPKPSHKAHKKKRHAKKHRKHAHHRHRGRGRHGKRRHASKGRAGR